MKIEDIPSLEQQSLELASMFGPWMMILFSVIVVMLLKDLATKISKGLSFKLSGTFKEGDMVYIDGDKAIITKIGITQTVFDIVKDHNRREGDECSLNASGQRTEIWRYVPNERIPFLKIEKIIKE